MTSGTSGRIRKALELSISTAPAATARGAKALEVEPPADASTISIPSNDRLSTASTVISSPRNFNLVPADLGEAKSLSSAIGKLRLASSSINSVPTAPVAPKIATRYRSDKESCLH